MLTDGLLFLVCTIMQHHVVPCTWTGVRYNYGEQILNTFIICLAFISTSKKVS